MKKRNLNKVSGGSDIDYKCGKAASYGAAMPSSVTSTDGQPTLNISFDPNAKVTGSMNVIDKSKVNITTDKRYDCNQSTQRTVTSTSVVGG